MSKDNLSSSVSVSRVIPKEESSEFQTWSAPEVKSPADEEFEEISNVPMLTAEQLEQIHQQAYQEGLQEGQQKGYDEGFAQGIEEGKSTGHKQAMDLSLEAIQQQTFHFEKIFKSLQLPYSQVSEQLEYEIVSLAMAIAKQIVSQEMNTQPEAIIPLVKKTLQLLPSHVKRIKIFLNPSDLKLIKNAVELNDDIDIENYRLYEDSDLKRGGCIVDTDISHIDASIDKRITDIAASLVPQAPDIPHRPNRPIDENELEKDVSIETVQEQPDNTHNAEAVVDTNVEAIVETVANSPEPDQQAFANNQELVEQDPPLQ